MTQAKKTFPGFKHEGRTYRLVSRIEMVRERGYAEPSEEHFNVLQVKLTNWLSILSNLSRWTDVEVENIPSFAWIDKATLGYTEWKSALHEKCCIQFGMVDMRTYPSRQA